MAIRRGLVSQSLFNSAAIRVGRMHVRRDFGNDHGLGPVGETGMGAVAGAWPIRVVSRGIVESDSLVLSAFDGRATFMVRD